MHKTWAISSQNCKTIEAWKSKRFTNRLRKGEKEKESLKGVSKALRKAHTRKSEIDKKPSWKIGLNWIRSELIVKRVETPNKMYLFMRVLFRVLPWELSFIWPLSGVQLEISVKYLINCKVFGQYWTQLPWICYKCVKL